MVACDEDYSTGKVWASRYEGVGRLPRTGCGLSGWRIGDEGEGTGVGVSGLRVAWRGFDRVVRGQREGEEGGGGSEGELGL